MCALNRAQKTELVDKYRSVMSDCKMALLLEYTGSKVSDLDPLRAKLRASQSSFMIIKNRLFKKAIEGTHFEKLGDNLTGPLALVTSKDNIVDPAKTTEPVISDESTKFRLHGAISFESPELLSAQQFMTIAKLPSREELLAKMMGSMRAPIQNFVSVLSAVPRNLVYVLSQLSKQKE